MQQIGFSNKTYSIWNSKKPVVIKRKGHLLHNPTEKQIFEVEEDFLKKSKIEQWTIENNLYESSWPQRPLDVIDTIVIGATDYASWNSKNLYDFDTSDKNNVRPGFPLPGISYHIFINASGVVEKIADYSDIIEHTKGINTRSIGVVIQYGITDNNAEPTTKIMKALERTLALLCLEFKLNPYLAIKGQREIKSISPFSVGHKGIEKISPGLLLSMDELRRRVAITLKRKLKYGLGLSNPSEPEFDSIARTALNQFNSRATKHLYSNEIKYNINSI